MHTVMVLDAGKMYRPTDIAVDLAGNSVFVVEQFNHRVSKWNYTPPSFTFTLDSGWGSNSNGTAGGPGIAKTAGDDFFYFPTGCIINGVNLLVTDTFNHRVKLLKVSNGDAVTTVGTGGTGTSEPQFYRPTGIDISPTRILIADSRNHRCVSYTTATPPVFSEISDAPSPVPFHTPRGVVFNTTDTQFNVFDEQEGVGSVYDTTGKTFASQFGTPGDTIANVTELYAPSGGHGETAGQESPFADTRNNAIKLVNSTVITNPSTPINTPGTGPGEMYLPASAIAFTDNTTNYLLVVNTLNHRVDVFNGAGVLKSTFGTPF